MVGERTPLLHQASDPFRQEQCAAGDWKITEGLLRISASPVSSINLEDLLCGGVDPSQDIPPINFAYAFVLLLQLRQLRIAEQPTKLDVYSQWSQNRASEGDVKSLDHHLQELLQLFLSEYRTEQDIDCVLWSSFSEDAANSRKLRVVDFLVNPDAPKVLWTHLLIEAALERRWKHGRSFSTLHLPVSTSWLARIESALATPRSLHFATMGSQLVYLVFLVIYLLHPPGRVTTRLGYYSENPAQVALIVFLVSNAISTLTSSRALFIGALLVFGLALPQCPDPGDGFFEALLVIFGFHILLLHFPRIPSPALLLSPSKTLPLSLFMVRTVANVLPAYLFFGPTLVLSLVLLSHSLDDYYYRILRLINSNAFFSAASPLETRWAFFAIAIVVSLLWILSTFMASIVIPILDRMDPPTDKWDRFGISTGRQARIIAILACIKFDAPYMFPPPFNLVSLLFIAPFEYGASIINQNPPFVHQWRILVWRVIVLPFLLPIFCLSKLLP